nr:chromosome-associated kinesin KIF4A [Onthophagus taurus]
MSDSSSVTVAVRIRPLIPSETAKGCQEILEVYEDINQIKIKTSDKAFSYNYVCNHNISQKDFYDTCVKNLIGNLFKGYNVTILAYGQTGSGKTHSMGTAYNGDDNVGIIPRAVREIFDYVKDNFGYEFSVSVSFIEIYQEVVYDLLANRPREQCSVELREDVKGIIIPGLTEEIVKTPLEALEFLTKGSQGRAMASTNMNSQSSRSHAIYTVNISMLKKDDSNQNKTARFHLVDLAGSERQKKTGATGQTFKEGVNINKGLLALGNVISALGDEKTQNNYICYRDSNLTRLLKDSLGGNSITLMIACVSPADYNLEETLSTLRYADRARKIKNKPIVNQDPKAAEINKLQKVIQQLRLELVGQGGPIICPAEMELLKKELNDTKTKYRLLNVQLGTCLNENGILHEKLHMVDLIPELMNKLKAIIDECNELLVLNENSGGDGDENNYYKEKIVKFKELFIQLSDIYNEQMKIVKDITKQENENFQLESTNDSQSEHELSEQQEGHTAQQLALNNEFQEVRRQLAMKERLVKCMESNVMFIDPNIITDCESKIAVLEKEKEELLQQLKNVQTNGPSKISENRRKRVQGLEDEILDLKRKVIDHEKLLKHKKTDEEKIKKLNGEILTMKQNKVTLMRKIRQESDRFRTWKLQKERDVLKLKEQDRKRQNQIVKMEMMHTRQQNVLKRKVEEAAAVNKRLKESLAKRKTVADKRQGKNEKIGEWIQQELEVYVNILEAEAAIPNLIEDRGNLQKQLDFLKADPDVEDNEDAVNQISDEIELRTAQITDLQQKLLDSQEDIRSQTRFDNIQSMLEAKHALKMMFDSVAEIKRGTFTAESKVQDQNREIENLKKQNAILERKIKENEKFKCELIQEYEEKMLLLLGHGDIESKDDQLKECIEMQKRSIQMLEMKEAQLIIEIQTLKDTVQKNVAAAALDVTFEKPKRPKTKHVSLKVPINEKSEVSKEDNDETQETNQEKDENKTPQSAVYKLKETLTQNNLFTPDFEPEDNVVNDPDWHKTPLARKLKANREVLERPKRTSEGGCSCKTNCSSRNCGCRKTGRVCDERCKCRVEKCTYRQDNFNQNGSTEQTMQEDDDDDDFLVQPPKLNVDESLSRIKRKKRAKQETLRL